MQSVHARAAEKSLLDGGFSVKIKSITGKTQSA
jgi:hypothetical protein